MAKEIKQSQRGGACNPRTPLRELRAAYTRARDDPVSGSPNKGGRVIADGNNVTHDVIAGPRWS